MSYRMVLDPASGYSRREVLALVGGAAYAASRVVHAEPVDSANAKKTLRGIFPIMATPYTESKAVDYEDLAHEVEFLDRCGVPGMVWPQLLGETVALNVEERKRGMDVIAKAAKGKKPAIVLGIDGPNLSIAMSYLEHAEALNPDALIALPPREATSIGEIVSYYRALAGAVKRPLFIQNSELTKGLKLTVPALVDLAREFPHCAYFKEEVQPSIERMQELATHRPTVQRVFAGEAAKNLMYVMRLGMDGCMAGHDVADVLVQIWDLFAAGQETKSRELYGKLLLVLNCESYLDGTRQYIMKKRGVFKTMVSRRGQFSFSKEQARELDFHFDALTPYLKA